MYNWHCRWHWGLRLSMRWWTFAIDPVHSLQVMNGKGIVYIWEHISTKFGSKQTVLHLIGWKESLNWCTTDDSNHCSLMLSLCCILLYILMTLIPCNIASCTLAVCVSQSLVLLDKGASVWRCCCCYECLPCVCVVVVVCWRHASLQLSQLLRVCCLSSSWQHCCGQHWLILESFHVPLHRKLLTLSDTSVMLAAV